jgi:hypothetical protein
MRLFPQRARRLVSLADSGSEFLDGSIMNIQDVAFARGENLVDLFCY